jgi:hypothetical protein
VFVGSTPRLASCAAQGATFTRISDMDSMRTTMCSGDPAAMRHKSSPPFADLSVENVLVERFRAGSFASCLQRCET